MKNPNDNSAKIYDVVNQPLKNEEVTSEEIKLITSLVPEKGKILDIGCGTGRHLIPLKKLGYKVTGVELSEGMLDVLKTKLRSDKTCLVTMTKVVYGDFFKIKFRQKFDLVIMMWNAFNEIILTEKKAKKIFEIFRNILKTWGKVLINIDNPENLNLKKLIFHTAANHKGRVYEQDWKVINYNEKTNTTVSNEEITIKENTGKVIKKIKSKIKQRWWSKKQISIYACKYGFKVEEKKLKISNEYYLVISQR